jgi:hypothetical protein
VSVVEAEPTPQPASTPLTLAHVIAAGRYAARCRTVGDQRSVLVVLGDILSPEDAIRFAQGIERQLGPERMKPDSGTHETGPRR